MEIDETKIIVIPSDTEIPVHNNHVQTKRPLCAEFPQNSIILDKTEAIKVITDISEDLATKPEETCINNIPVYLEELQAVFDPLKTEECSSDLFENGNYTVIDSIKDLQKILSELLVRFDTNPKYYLKEDYLYLLTVLYKSLIFLYQRDSKDIILGDNFKAVAYAEDNVVELKYPVATQDSVVTNKAQTLPSVEYLDKFVLKWEEF